MTNLVRVTESIQTTQHVIDGVRDWRKLQRSIEASLWARVEKHHGIRGPRPAWLLMDWSWSAADNAWVCSFDAMLDADGWGDPYRTTERVTP